MTMEDDFLSALQKGRAAAVEAERNRAEIWSVLADLERQLNAMGSSHKLTVRIIEKKKPDDGAFVPRGMAGMAFVPPQKRYSALEVKADNGHTIELCEFNQGPRGYPIEMRDGKTFETIFDRPSLVAALRDLLGRPHVGSFFNSILGSPGESSSPEVYSPSPEGDASDPASAAR